MSADLIEADRVASAIRGQREVETFVRVIRNACATGTELCALLRRLEPDADAFAAACGSLQKLVERRGR